MIEGYGRALFELAKEEGLEEGIYRDFSMAAELWSENPQLSKLLDVPSVSTQEREEILERIFAGEVNEYFLRFLKLLSKRRLSSGLGRAFQAYEALYFQDQGIITVLAVTAVEMPEKLKKRLVDMLEKRTGKTIHLKTQVDPGCIGGLSVEFNHIRIDGAVKTELEQIGRRLGA